MPINPFRPMTNYDIPSTPAPPKPDPSVFANLAGIGESIGAYRDQQQLMELSKSAVDPRTGQLDMNKFATSLALSGRDPLRVMAQIETMRHQRESEKNAAALAKAAQIAAERKLWTFDPNDPAGPGWRAPPDLANPGGIWKPVEQGPTILPRTAPPAPAVKPQSALPGGPNVAAFDPNDPENAPPYQVAGPPQPPPQQPPQNVPVVQAKPATPQPASELPPDFEARIAPLPEGKRNEIRGLATYQDDPYKIKFPTEPLQRAFFNQMRDLVPGWSPEKYGLLQEERKKAEALQETGPKAEQTKLGQERANIEADAVKDAKAAVELQPLLDDITKTWEQLVNFRRFGGLQTGTGALAGTEAARALQRLGGGTTEEQLRQAYERTIAALRARVTSAMNQGQGAVSNYERQMYNQIFPEFTTSNPTGELATLKQLQARNAQVANIGRETGLGKATPGYLGERPAIERGQRQFFDAETADQYRKNPEMTLNRARQLIQRGVNPAEVRDALRSIDPSLPGKL